MDVQSAEMSIERTPDRMNRDRLKTRGSENNHCCTDDAPIMHLRRQAMHICLDETVLPVTNHEHVAVDARPLSHLRRPQDIFTGQGRVSSRPSSRCLTVKPITLMANISKARFYCRVSWTCVAVQAYTFFKAVVTLPRQLVPTGSRLCGNSGTWCNEVNADIRKEVAPEGTSCPLTHIGCVLCWQQEATCHVRGYQQNTRRNGIINGNFGFSALTGIRLSGLTPRVFVAGGSTRDGIVVIVLTLWFLGLDEQQCCRLEENDCLQAGMASLE
ncbi:hypothetical protein RRG08_023801 [Elysia crispata]|uniref:Uncharacterized protein n=1 Tax=Elysia crispata TaxID=231223 RepID=A0AAE0ZVU2_9GAST|nr:hypothetical protein RRG08_023801 [Elysia crispata]